MCLRIIWLPIVFNSIFCFYVNASPPENDDFQQLEVAFRDDPDAAVKVEVVMLETTLKNDRRHRRKGKPFADRLDALSIALDSNEKLYRRFYQSGDHNKTQSLLTKIKKEIDSILRGCFSMGQQNESLKKDNITKWCYAVARFYKDDAYDIFKEAVLENTLPGARVRLIENISENSLGAVFRPFFCRFNAGYDSTLDKEKNAFTDLMLATENRFNLDERVRFKAMLQDDRLLESADIVDKMAAVVAKYRFNENYEEVSQFLKKSESSGDALLVDLINKGYCDKVAFFANHSLKWSPLLEQPE